MPGSLRLFDTYVDQKVEAYFPLKRTDRKVIELLNFDQEFLYKAIAERWRNSTETDRVLLLAAVLHRAEALFETEVHASLECGGRRFRELIYRVPLVGEHRALNRRQDGRLGIAPLPIRYIIRSGSAHRNVGSGRRRQLMEDFAGLIATMVPHDRLGNIEVVLESFAAIPFEPSWLRKLLADDASRKEIACAFLSDPNTTGAKLAYSIIYDLSGRPGSSIRVLQWESLRHFRRYMKQVVNSEVAREQRRRNAA